MKSDLPAGFPANRRFLDAFPIGQVRLTTQGGQHVVFTEVAALQVIPVDLAIPDKDARGNCRADLDNAPRERWGDDLTKPEKRTVAI